jgi:hypothetical protein
MWIYQGDELTEIPEGYLGFIYLITCLTNNKRYIGKKIFKNKKTKYRKNKRNVHTLVESNWQEYTGSSETLNEDITTLGKDKFKFEILYLCVTKAEMGYMETKYIFDYDALLRDDFYNAWVSAKITKMHLKKCTERLLQNVKSPLITP